HPVLRPAPSAGAGPRRRHAVLVEPGDRPPGGRVYAEPGSLRAGVPVPGGSGTAGGVARGVGAGEAAGAGAGGADQGGGAAGSRASARRVVGCGGGVVWGGEAVARGGAAAGHARG